ncbi:MAG: Carbon monoxide dehydrogenase [Actinomycetia bacterium]|nr:Carbon monoxide dehydrogenase [Actinomycetes bacterium]
MTTSGSILGHPVRRKEDPGILNGTTRYFDDLAVVGLVNIAFVRSTIAHAHIESIDTSEAAAMPGVLAVYTADDLSLPDQHGFLMLPPTANRPPLARGTVRFVGDIVAAVVADTRTHAIDAVEMVVVDYDPLPAVMDPEAALVEGSPLVHEAHGSNLAIGMGTGEVDDIFGDADVVVTQRMHNQRLAGIPMENNGIVAVPGEPDGGITVWVPTQAPHGLQAPLATVLGLEPAQVRVVAPAVGGGFGPKAGDYVEFQIVAAAAMRLGRPVKWTETRSENLLSMIQGRGQVQHVELGLKRDGTITGLRVRVVGEAGAYPAIGAFLPFFTQTMSQGVYVIPKIEFNWQSAITNTTTTGAYRGAGRPEAAALLERIIDIAARELGIDPVEIRHKNFIPAADFPLTTLTGAAYDTGEYAKALDAAIAAAGYDELRADQRARRERGDTKQLGIGIASYVEITAPVGLHAEYGAVEVHEDGSVTAKVGTSAHGQGHETAFAMIVAELLGVPMDKVTLVQSDTALVPRGQGTMGSRSLQTAGSAVWRASEMVLEQAKQLAAHLLEASPDDIVLGEGGVQVAGVPTSALTWGDLVRAARDDSKRPEGMAAELAAELDFDAGQSSFPFGSHIAVVEVDTDTGRVELVRHIAVDDCGRILNPLLVAGQQHGGIAQGAAQALFEEIRYDEDGNPITGNLMDYAIPSAAELPSFEVSNTETPTPLNPLGAKGIGESGTIGSTPAVHNAVIDALSHLGIRHIDMPCTAEKVWRAIQDVHPA